LKRALADRSAGELSQIAVAYEPIWAIGTGRAATVEQAVTVHRSIRGYIATGWNEEIASATRILYGGSVTTQNIDSLLASEEIDGALVGGACLDPDSFARIALAAHKRLP
jgi:triosephosphate isomerase